MGEQRVIQGTVVSDKMDKTVVVAVTHRKKHRLYHKVMTLTTRFKAHDEANTCRLGDTVRIIESRPLSRDKRWRVLEVLGKGDVADIQPASIGRELEQTVQVSATAAAAADDAATPESAEGAAADEEAVE